MNTMKSEKISQAIILAAGFGKRLRPLTLSQPKPLIKVNKKPIIFYILEELRNNNILECFINVHYLPEKIIEYINNYSKDHKSMNINTIYEKNILDTGGAIKNISQIHNTNPILVINGDSIILPTIKSNPVKELIDNFDKKSMSFLLLLDNNKNSIGYYGNGDFKLMTNKEPTILKRSSRKNIAYTGWQIVNPISILKINNNKFSLNLCYDEAIKNKLLWGIINKGKWLHIGDNKSLIKSEKWIKKNKK